MEARQVCAQSVAGTARDLVDGLHERDRSDEALLTAARAGDGDAVAELYERHRGAALGRAAGWAHHEYGAEDLVADAFVSLLRALSTGGGPDSSVRGYLAVTMRNAAASQARRRRHPATPGAAEDDLLHRVPDAGPAPDHDLLREDTRAHVASALAQLQPSWRQVLVMTAVEGLSMGQAAERLGMSPQAARALAYRARGALREAYAAAEQSRPRGVRHVDGVTIRQQLPRPALAGAA